MSVDVAADGPGTTTDGNPPSEATLDAALEIALATEETGIGNGRTTTVPDWLAEEPALEALGWELPWLEADVPSEVDALPADWEAAIPLDTAVAEPAEPATVDVDPEGDAGGTDTGNGGTDDAVPEPVRPSELPTLEPLEPEETLDGEFVDGDWEPELAPEPLEAEGTLRNELIDGDLELEPTLEALEAGGTLGIVFVAGDAVEPEVGAALFETDADVAGSADAGAGLEGTGAGRLTDGPLDPAVELLVTGVGSTVTVVVPTIVVVP